MKVKFNGKVYSSKERGNSLRKLCFDIFKYYLKQNPNKSSDELKEKYENILWFMDTKK